MVNGPRLLVIARESSWQRCLLIRPLVYLQSRHVLSLLPVTKKKKKKKKENAH